MALNAAARPCFGRGGAGGGAAPLAINKTTLRNERCGTEPSGLKAAEKTRQMFFVWAVCFQVEQCMINREELNVTEQLAQGALIHCER